MNLAAVDKIAKAVLYEGYMLYPYRPSAVKNQQRWNFGVLCPRSYSEAQNGTEAWTMQTECLVEGDLQTAIDVHVRFLQLVTRAVGECGTCPQDSLPNLIPAYRIVSQLAVGDCIYRPWQEAMEREISLLAIPLDELTRASLKHTFVFEAHTEVERLLDEGDQVAGVLVRERQKICCDIEINAGRLRDGLYKLRVVIRNATVFEQAKNAVRDEALLHGMASTHTILGVQAGQFASLLAPPEDQIEVIAACENIGCWPVLVGEAGQRDTLLSSPIILYDYPQIAPESAGELFDGTEIDEILSLRILTLTDEEKQEMSQSDEHARQMLERTESMPAEQFMKLHGVLRGLRAVTEAQ